MKKVNSLSEIGITRKSRILIVFPHPDDETAFTAGLIQKAAKFNIPVKLSVLTAGEKSTLRYGLKNNQDLGRVRLKELEKVAKILKITDYKVEKYSDSNLHQEKKFLLKHIKEEITNFNPSHVITFEPAGVYGHNDHILISSIVTDIYKNEKNNPFKLIYATVPHNYKHSVDNKNILNKNINTPLRPNFCLNLTAQEVINKTRAFHAHRSQFQINHSFLQEWLFTKILLREHFYFVD
jgi:LmbE family N-acetylglucosaminyl deacetylase